ncbi:hypothetical protein B0T18DRAFT_492024, partial [Schizothecium vesticola]
MDQLCPPPAPLGAQPKRVKHDLKPPAGLDKPKVVSDPLSADDDSDGDFHVPSRTARAAGRTLVKTPSSSRPHRTNKSIADHQLPVLTPPSTVSASRQPQPTRKAKGPPPVALDELDHRVAEDDNDAYPGVDDGDVENASAADDDDFDDVPDLDDQGLCDLERELRESDPRYIGEDEIEDDKLEEEDDGEESSNDDNSKWLEYPPVEDKSSSAVDTTSPGAEANITRFKDNILRLLTTMKRFCEQMWADSGEEKFDSFWDGLDVTTKPMAKGSFILLLRSDPAYLANGVLAGVLNEAMAILGRENLSFMDLRSLPLLPDDCQDWGCYLHTALRPLGEGESTTWGKLSIGDSLQEAGNYVGSSVNPIGGMRARSQAHRLAFRKRQPSGRGHYPFMARTGVNFRISVIARYSPEQVAASPNTALAEALMMVYLNSIRRYTWAAWNPPGICNVSDLMEHGAASRVRSEFPELCCSSPARSVVSRGKEADLSTIRIRLALDFVPDTRKNKFVGQTGGLLVGHASDVICHGKSRSPFVGRGTLGALKAKGEPIPEPAEDAQRHGDCGNCGLKPWWSLETYKPKTFTAKGKKSMKIDVVPIAGFHGYSSERRCDHCWFWSSTHGGEERPQAEWGNNDIRHPPERQCQNPKCMQTLPVGNTVTSYVFSHGIFQRCTNCYTYIKRNGYERYATFVAKLPRVIRKPAVPEDTQTIGAILNLPNMRMGCQNENCRAQEGSGRMHFEGTDRRCTACYYYKKNTAKERPRHVVEKTNAKRAKMPKKEKVDLGGCRNEHCRRPESAGGLFSGKDENRRCDACYRYSRDHQGAERPKR